MRKVGVEVRNGQDNQQKSFGKAFKSIPLLHVYLQEGIEPILIPKKKKEYLRNYLTPSLVIDRERKKKEVSQPVGTLAENAPKEFAADKVTRVVLVSTFC